MVTRTLVAARSQLVSISKQLSNQIRGLLKTFGLIVPKAKDGAFDANVRTLLDGKGGLAAAWRDVRKRASNLDHQLLVASRQSRATKLLMTVPGVGAVTAVSYIAAIEDPENFPTSRSVGAWLGLTTRRYQSGEIDYDGHISRRGDSRLRGLLYEAATVLLTRTTARTECSLKTWGLKLRERLGFKRAAVAVARKLAVIMHSMLKDGEAFNPLAGAAA
jgi:error-prone DNA polymerase